MAFMVRYLVYYQLFCPILVLLTTTSVCVYQYLNSFLGKSNLTLYYAIITGIQRVALQQVRLLRRHHQYNRARPDQVRRHAAHRPLRPPIRQAAQSFQSDQVGRAKAKPLLGHARGFLRAYGW